MAQQYVILSRLEPEAMSEPDQFKRIASDVSEHIKQQCPSVKWQHSFATMGRFDVVDIVEADDPKEVERAAMLIRTHGRAYTETMLATPWEEFKNYFSES